MDSREVDYAVTQGGRAIHLVPRSEYITLCGLQLGFASEPYYWAAIFGVSDEAYADGHKVLVLSGNYCKNCLRVEESRGD